MGESKHTPGPWEWDGNVWQYDEQNEAPWLIQAPYQDVRSKTVLSGRIRCNTEADARLIASAPELLDALIVCCDLIEGEGFEPPGNARAAIAKATGGE